VIASARDPSRNPAEGQSSIRVSHRFVLHELLSSPPWADGLGSRIHARFSAADAFDLDPPSRSEMPRAAVFER
jgi:hypothetical protein